MAIIYDDIMALKSEGQEFTYGDRETMLYALGVGFGRDPLNTKELPFVYEKGLVTLPTMSSVIAWGAGNMAQSGINYAMERSDWTCTDRYLSKARSAPSPALPA